MESLCSHPAWQLPWPLPGMSENSLSINMVLQSVRKAACGPFGPSLQQAVLQRQYALPGGECETWAIPAAEENRCCFSVGLRPGAATVEWQCLSEDGCLQTLVTLGQLSFGLEEFAQMAPLP